MRLLARASRGQAGEGGTELPREPMSKLPEPIPLWALFTGVGGIWLVSWALLTLFLGLPDAPGTFGDSFGAVNALFGGLALVGIYHAIELQRQEIALQQRELKLLRTELGLQREQLHNQIEELEASRGVYVEQLEEMRRATALQVQPFVAARFDSLDSYRELSLDPRAAPVRLEACLTAAVVPITEEPAVNVVVDVLILDGGSGGALVRLEVRRPILTRALSDGQGYQHPLSLEADQARALLAAIAADRPLVAVTRVTLGNLLGAKFESLELRRVPYDRERHPPRAAALAGPPPASLEEQVGRVRRAEGHERERLLGDLRRLLVDEREVIAMRDGETIQFESRPVTGTPPPAAELPYRDPVKGWLDAALVHR